MDLTKPGYRVETHEHGAVIFGSLPIDDFVALSALYKARGWDQLAPGVATALHATMVLTSADAIPAWSAALNLKAEKEAGDDAEH